MALLNMIFFLLICSGLNMANCGALILYVGAGALQEAFAALREAQQPDTADKLCNLPVLDPENEDVISVGLLVPGTQTRRPKTPKLRSKIGFKMANTNNNNKTLAQPRHPISEAET
ncbi:hypothetical protein CMV_025737 [Castanea mollissima]|uniref:WDR11 TPR domain-containing protein n=1 Tax=Castanea mollissima TaxID=60419 RepID=A0A8J4QLE0_9ROSI|nr:hypothetical protein CMV_025737 [Castanea mollissima]